MLKLLSDSTLIKLTGYLTTFCQRLSPSAALVLGKSIGIIAFYLFPVRRRITLQNLRMALDKEKPEKELRAIAWRMSQNLGCMVIDFLRLPLVNLSNIDSYVQINGLANMTKALSLKRGVLVLTAHFGNFDLAAAAMALKGFPTSLITKHLSIPAFNNLWLKYRDKLGIKQLYREGSLKTIIQRLKNNELIGFVIDQNTHRDEGVFVNFFGIPACTIPAVAVLAQRFNTPVVPMFIVRKKNGTHQAFIEPHLIFESRPTLEESIVYNTQLYTNIIEKYIRRHPDHWTWLHYRWKTRPEGEPPIYQHKHRRK
ncbi:lysophospholipid acyltransferase family protein [Planctomycetota bacterium]